MNLTLPLLVFVAELSVVTLATIRIIFLSRGRKVPASILGFFEITIWLFAIGQVMRNLDNISCHIAFATGFTLGNFLGVVVEKRLGIGTLVVRIITNRDASDLILGLRAADYGVTSLDAEGAKGPVKVVFSVVPRKELRQVLGIVRNFDPRAFYSVDEIQSAGQGIFPAARRGLRGVVPSSLEGEQRAA